jgi:hypothetical protein
LDENHPYIDLPRRQMWRNAVADVDAVAIAELSSPKRKILGDDAIGTAGSCFAQHISRHLRTSGYNFVDVETAPELLAPARHAEFGFGLYSARYGNIYTVAQLRQLVERAYNRWKPVEQPWRHGARFHDPFRPNIEPDGYASAEEVANDTFSHLRAVRKLFEEINVFVFTLGLTESWRSRADGSVFPVAPGVRGVGTFDPGTYEFVNAGFESNRSDLAWTMDFLKDINPRLHFVLTVSPVPLAATASDAHVLTATTYSKSVLRAVAGELSATRDDVDYFPSYEIVTAPAYGGRFYAPNKREVTPEGVAHVMGIFLREFVDASAPPPRPVSEDAEEANDDVVCEEAILEEYARS